MGQQALKVPGAGSASQPRLLLVDGFAGPGRYATGEPGSPLIMLEALTSHVALPRLGGVKFMFLFIEQDQPRVEHLRDEVARFKLPANAEVVIEQGQFEQTISNLVGRTSPAQVLVPTFAFIDPFGYSTASMSLTGRLLDFPRSEALFFLPLSYIHRFVGRAGQEAALTSLFDTDDWRGAIPLSGDERRKFLVRLFESQLQRQGQVKHVISFELRTMDGNDYRLIFASGHPAGRKAMKQAMWKVDPQQGTRYVAHTDRGQEVLFTSAVDTQPLLDQLRRAFGNRWFSPAEARAVTEQTLFLEDSHLKKLTLLPAEENGIIEVKRPPGRRRGSFTDDTKIRFL
jgi:three-Cys-motif partner protein